MNLLMVFSTQIVAFGYHALSIQHILINPYTVWN